MKVFGYKIDQTENKFEHFACTCDKRDEVKYERELLKYCKKNHVTKSEYVSTIIKELNSMGWIHGSTMADMWMIFFMKNKELNLNMAITCDFHEYGLLLALKIAKKLKNEKKYVTKEDNKSDSIDQTEYEVLEYSKEKDHKEFEKCIYNDYLLDCEHNNKKKRKKKKKNISFEKYKKNKFFCLPYEMEINDHYIDEIDVVDNKFVMKVKGDKNYKVITDSLECGCLLLSNKLENK